MKRLIKKSKRINKTASVSFVDFDCFYLNSGAVIGFGSRIVNNKPWFQVYQEDTYATSSFYDGPDYEKAMRTYQDLLTAFKGISRSENFSNRMPKIKSEIEQMLVEKKEDDYNFQKLKKNPLFLGIPRSEDF